VPAFNHSTQDSSIERWVSMHIEDSNNVLRKPILITEFGWPSRVRGYPIANRARFYEKIYNRVYYSARNRGACAGAAFWQLFVQGMGNLGDGYEVVFQEDPSTTKIISQQSLRMSKIR